MITDHKWRPATNDKTVKGIPWSQRPCHYANCGQPITAHTTAVTEWRHPGQ